MKAGSPWMPLRSPKPPRLEQEPQNMPATIVDSAIFGNLFSTEAMRQVWSDENRTRKYLDIEAALARVQARLGIIPAKAAAEIVRNCRLEKIDLSKLRAQTERIGYPVLGLVQQLVELCADGLGEWCHWAPPPRTSPTPPRCCKSARASCSSRTISARSRLRWRSSP